MSNQTRAEPSPVSDQKKRALDALERRFALARSELVQEEQRKKRKESSKKQQNGALEKTDEASSCATVPSTPGTHIPPLMKGKLELSGKASQKRISSKTGADFHPVYSELFDGIDNKLLNSGSNASSRADVVNKVVYDLLQHGEEWNKFRRSSLKKKIDHGILLDNFVSNVGVSTNARAKALQSHSKRSQNHMSRRQHRKCGSFDMPKECHRFEHFKPMHDMWKAYILELLEKSNKKQLIQCLLMADLHGAFIAVVGCKTASFVGVSGLMIRETAETFGIIKQDNHFRVVPKRGSVFIIQAGCWKVTLLGDKLSLRTSPNA